MEVTDKWTVSDEVDDLQWYQIDEVIARENNCSGMHWDKYRELL